MRGSSATEAFMPAVSPATLQIVPNEHYKTPEDYTWALAEAIREEYRAIVDAGFILQIDDPAIVDIYDWWFSLNDDMAGYRKWAAVSGRGAESCARGIPEDRVRYHICWGSWHGPHKTDVPLKDVVDLLLKVKAQAYSVEAGNVRHEHEWKVWRDTKLPDGKLLIPGVVSHATNVLEHPEVIADRLHQLRECRRPRERHRRHGLRARRTSACAACVGKVACAARRRRSRLEAVVEVARGGYCAAAFVIARSRRRRSNLVQQFRDCFASLAMTYSVHLRTA